MARPPNDAAEFAKKLLQKIVDARNKPSVFAKEFLKYEPYSYNAEYLDCMDKFLAYRSGRKVGKTMSTATKALHFAWYAPFMSKDAKQRGICDIVIVAPSQNQANIMFDMITTLCTRSVTLNEYVVKKKATELWLGFIDGKGVSRIYTRAAGERGDSIRGYVPHVIIIDEAAFVRHRVIEALIPAGLATDAKIWLTSTPFGKSGYFYRICLNSKAGNKLAQEQGYNNQEGRWTQFYVPTTSNPKADKEYLAEMKMLTKDAFETEIMGNFLEVGNALIPRELIQNAIGDYKLPNDVRYVLSVDVARGGKDETVFCVLAYDQEGIVYVIEAKGYSSNTIVETVNTVQEYLNRYKGLIDTVYMDQTGLGVGAVEMAVQRDMPVRGVTFSLQEKEKLYNNLVMLFENGKIKLGDGGFDGKLAFQLSYLTKSYTKNNYMRIESEEHDDWPDALALGCKCVYSGEEWHVLDSIDEITVQDQSVNDRLLSRSMLYR